MTADDADVLALRAAGLAPASTGIPSDAISDGSAKFGTFRRLLIRYTTLLYWLERLSMAVGGVCFAAIVLVTAVDVGMRYLLNSPLVWSYTLISDYLMVATFFFALGATQRQGQNIGVDILTRRLPDRLRAPLSAANLMLMIGLIGFIGWSGWGVFEDAWESGDVLAGVIPWPRWPALLMVPLGCGLLLLRLIAGLAADVAASFGARDLATWRTVRTSHGFGIE